MHEQSDRFCTDMTLKTATGEEMSLAEFYDRKRVYMHKALFDVPGISPRNIDDVYMSFIRMLEPASGRVAHTIEQYIVDPKLRSTGNWGKSCANAFLEEGGVMGRVPTERSVARGRPRAQRFARTLFGGILTATMLWRGGCSTVARPRCEKNT
ncbi:MAG UNVERIFIED_CONTAM: hypothetical protein LVT10_27580 [Anaerolineae bacterium]